MIQKNTLCTFSNIIENKIFQKNPLLIQLGFFTKYIFMFTEYEYLTLTPLQMNINNKNMEIIIGTYTHDILYINIYKDIIISKISRFFYSEFIITLNIITLY
jgi:hypothetical protein